MSTKYTFVCDRCGKEKEGLHKYRYHVTRFYHHTLEKELDLCDECSKDLKKFLENKKHG